MQENALDVRFRGHSIYIEFFGSHFEKIENWRFRTSPRLQTHMDRFWMRPRLGIEPCVGNGRTTRWPLKDRTKGPTIREEGRERNSMSLSRKRNTGTMEQSKF